MIDGVSSFISLSERLLGMYADRKQLVSDTDAFVRALQIELHYNRSLLDAINIKALSNSAESLGIVADIVGALRTTMLETLLIQQNSPAAKKAIDLLKATAPVDNSAYGEVEEQKVTDVTKKNLMTAAEFVVVKIDTLRAVSFLVGEKNDTIRRNTRVKTRLENIVRHLAHINDLVRRALDDG